MSGLKKDVKTLSDIEPSQFSAFLQKPGQTALRGKFLSRLFGIFNEEIVRFWAADERCPYRDLGRPTVFDPRDAKGSTLDFTFEDRATEKRFVVEMKCEIEFQGYRFMTLRESGQLSHHKKPAFDLFRSIARDHQFCRVQVQRQPIEVAGAILIWGDVTEAGRSAIIADCGFHDVIGMNRILEDLWLWRPKPFVSFIQSLGNWSNELFEFLIDKEQQMIPSFKNDDEGFRKWRDTHPNGFICNIPYPNAQDEREYNLGNICLHTAMCTHMARNRSGDGVWTTNKYFKICADDFQIIDGWISAHAELPTGWQLRRCSKCKP
jgi:hypothetical protein